MNFVPSDPDPTPGSAEHGFSPFFSTSDLTAATPSGVSPNVSSPSMTSRPDEFMLSQDYLSYREELRSLIFHTAQSAAPTRQGSPAGADEVKLTHELHNGHLQSHRDTARILSIGKRVFYLRNYVEQVASWLDMFDGDRVFGMQIPSLAQTSPPLLYAILALSARQIECKEKRKNSFDSLELYQEAIRLLAPLLVDRDVKIIPICVILCCLEMMSASAQDWRRHLEGCAALFSTFGVHGFSGGMLQAVFWCYARMDLCGALISDGTQCTLFQPSRWLPAGTEAHEARSLFRASQNPDMHANYSVWLCAKTCKLISDRTRYNELAEQNGCTEEVFTNRWLALWDELQVWLGTRPRELHPVKTAETKPFPQILYVHWAAISSNQLHHTACILMLDSMPKPLKLTMNLGMAGSTLWHAKWVCGISLSNPHQGCINNAIQPLWLAGRLLSHRSEHEIIIKLLRSIESTTGWGSCWRIPDLESAWGYKVRKSGSNAAS
ncbi:uncharacterized protein BCR38DRAFT_329249 [Pseudomassariella vexata]|uniref:Fungal-specific transcription factor domain-domain-containing protein n=1 Tax=Pseudomassariella vexata TaxID=1141098 RepID=A0A1Y2EKK6_9PEZI|nr:uncharacterized protein BCR38DRAFT_329249 [Pseudomassariella vexata]ORY72080.1 hypothetical protein BCR38DRAFT_329249 [Pseudomassariella vexata]